MARFDQRARHVTTRYEPLLEREACDRLVQERAARKG